MKIISILALSIFLSSCATLSTVSEKKDTVDREYSIEVYKPINDTLIYSAEYTYADAWRVPDEFKNDKNPGKEVDLHGSTIMFKLTKIY